jgi:DNA-directed RNA polymerase beta subunit
MDPAKGHMFMQYGSTNIPLYPVLKNLGVNDTELSKHWGSGVVKANRDHFSKKEEASINKLYDRLVPPYRRTAQTTESKARAIDEYYRTTAMDPDVTEKTLGQGFKRVNSQALLKASQKLLDVHRKGVDTDDRDSLAFQTLHTVDDFIKERIQLEGRNVARKVRMKTSAQGATKPTLKKVLPVSPFTRTLRNFMTSSSLAAIPTQINPIEIVDSAVRVTALGEGGIGSERAVPDEARSLHHTQFGIIDPTRTPEDFKAGISVRTALWTKRDDRGLIHTLMRNARTGRMEHVPVQKLERATIAFPGETKKSRGISALRRGEPVSVSKKDVDYELPHPSFMFSPATTTVPMPESSQGNRIIMGSKMATQALPLIGREPPLVQVESYNKGRTFEQELADLVIPSAPMDGIVTKVDDDYIYMRPTGIKRGSDDVMPLVVQEHVLLDQEEFEKTGSDVLKVPYDSNFPLASKTYLHNNVKVKKGDQVRAGQHLADSNFTRDGRMALGRNLNVGYMAYYGANTNDGVVISESCSQKLTSEHMYKESMSVDNDTVLDKNKHKAQFGMRWTAQQYANLDAKGVAKKGTVVQPGDPLILALRKSAPTAEQRMLGKLKLKTPFREDTVVWDHKSPGTVIDVVVTSTRALLTVKTQESAGIGDKIAGRYGNKGVISKIVADDQMIQTKEGKPVDVLVTATGVISRINPAQIIEGAVSKVAQKTGKPVVVPSMSGRNNVKWAKDLLKQHGISDKEVLHNPLTGKDVKGPDGKGVMVGPQYMYKLFKSTDTNYSHRGVQDYDVNLQPSKGGTEGAKAMGRMEISGLVAHDARNVLKEVSTLKGTRNDEWWRAYQTGRPLPPLRTPFAYDKFTGMLNGAGVKVDKSGSHLILGPLTDNDVKKMSSGAITRGNMVREKDLTPEKGGLFDPIVTGGLSGDRWGHVDLAEPIVNPTFEDPVRRMLNMTKREFNATLRKEGGKGIQGRLKQLDPAAREAQLREAAKNATGAKLDGIVKQLKALRALRKQKLKPDQAYVISKLPVVPPKIRPILPSRGRRELLIADPNYLYRDTILANDSLKDAKKYLPPDEVARARGHLYDSTKAIFGLADPTSPQLKARGAKGFIRGIAGQGSPKRAFFHGKMLKVPQDLTGRGTIIPDLTLGMDEIGLPEQMMWKTFEPHVIRGLVRNGYKAVEAKNMVDDQHPVARDILMAESKQRPVIFNRAPTLHRHSMIGAYAKPVPGKTIHINPFAEKPMNADYDGDTVQVHVPATDLAVEDVKSMTLSNLLFGDKTRNDLMVFPQQDALLGIHAASKTKGGKKHKFKTKQDAIAAYRQGKIQLNDVVEIG